jgi:DNA-binding IclR family transcriptional regulator
MQESETLIVFRILEVLAKARDRGRAPPVEEIAEAALLDTPQAQRYLDLLKQVGVVRADVTPNRTCTYSLTRYGLGRLGDRSQVRPRPSFLDEAMRLKQLSVPQHREDSNAVATA